MADLHPVLDASAVLALFQEEDGADVVESLLADSIMSSVNLSEVIQKAAQRGADVEGIEHDLPALGVEIRPFGINDAKATADLWERTSRRGLSLGDRACLALADAVGGVAVTADRRWEGLAGVDVRVIR